MSERKDSLQQKCAQIINFSDFNIPPRKYNFVEFFRDIYRVRFYTNTLQNAKILHTSIHIGRHILVSWGGGECGCGLCPLCGSM